MSTYNIDIIKEDKINSLFIKANSEILKTANLKNVPELEFKNVLIDQWQKKFEAELIFENLIPSKIKFKNHADLINFLMKW